MVSIHAPVKARRTLAFRSIDPEHEEERYKFGRANKTGCGGCLLIIDGHFAFDMEWWLKDAEWTVIEFVFNQES